MGIRMLPHCDEVIENDAITKSHSPAHIPSAAVISLSAPNRIHHPSPESPGQHEGSSTVDLSLMFEPATNLEPEPMPATDHV